MVDGVDLETSESKNDKFFGTIGRFGTVLGIIWIVVQLFSYFTSPYEVIAEGSYIEQKLSPQVYDEVAKLSDEYEKEKKFSFYRFRNLDKMLSISRGYYKIQVVNSGNDELKNVKMELPINGYFKLMKSDSIVAPEVASDKFDGTINIGTMNPSDEIWIYAWADALSFYSLSDTKAKVTHSKGFNLVDFGQKVYGTHAEIINFIELFSIIIWLLPLLAVLIFFMSKTLSEERNSLNINDDGELSYYYKESGGKYHIFETCGLNKFPDDGWTEVKVKPGDREMCENCKKTMSK